VRRHGGGCRVNFDWTAEPLGPLQQEPRKFFDPLHVTRIPGLAAHEEFGFRRDLVGLVERVKREALLALKEGRARIRSDMALAGDDDTLADVLACAPPMLCEVGELLIAILARHPI